MFQEINDCIFNLLKGIFVEWLFDIYWVSTTCQMMKRVGSYMKNSIISKDEAQCVA